MKAGKTNKFVRPFCRIRKKKTSGTVNIPVPMPDSILSPLKRFCCFVAVENKDNVSFGSGVLTEIGLITAHHMFQGIEDPKEVWAAFYVDKNNWTIVELGEILLENKDNDIIVLSKPVLSSHFTSAKLGWKNKDALFIPTKLKAFGCPLGLFGKVWKPTFVGMSDKKIYTKGFVCQGISGGGIFSNEGGKWYLWAIHSGYYTHSNTLVSSIVKF